MEIKMIGRTCACTAMMHRWTVWMQKCGRQASSCACGATRMLGLASIRHLREFRKGGKNRVPDRQPTFWILKNGHCMNTLKLLAMAWMLVGLQVQAQSAHSPSEMEQISATLMDYIEGTANGEPERLKRAFHPDFNLYTVTEQDSLRIRSGKEYVANVKEGEKSNRIGRIISIDYEKDAAIAKAEIVIPNWRIFTDYFLLLKYEGAWKIVQKSYTWREYPKQAEK
jgi:Putative lumazine-binding